MNSMSYNMSRPGGPTGSTRFGVSGQPEQKKWGDTTSKAGEISRVFVGSVDYKTTSCDEIEQRFGNYGQIRGIDLNSKNFAFVQFSTVEEAQNACQSENGSFFKNKKIEVRLFDKSGHPTKGRGGGGGGGGPTGPTGPHFRDRSRSPNRLAGGRLMGGPTGTRHGSVVPNMAHEAYPFEAPPMPQAAEEPVIGNEAEIIVVNRDQWPYAEMIEQRIKRETGIRYVDMLFLHTPSSLNMTLNDLFERQTVYALVVAPVNEEHRSVTLHVLHNQTEHRNMPLEDALLLINKDFEALTGRPALPPPPAAGPYSGPSSSSLPADRSYGGNGDQKLPEEISYLLRTILSENGSQFLSATQLDLLIDYFQKQKSRLNQKNSSQSSDPYNTNPSTVQSRQQPSAVDFDKQRANLLDNPHVQAALSSLIQIGALGASNGANNSANNSSFGGQQTANSGVATTTTRRHPLLGTEVGSNNSIAGAPGGLVKYPAPQSYNQYSYQF